MSMDAFNRLQFESEIYSKLKEAETEAKLSNTRLTHEEVFSELRKKITIN